jgi:hypothetical protein
MIAGIKHVYLSAPPQVGACELTFAPTRSKIHCVSVVEPAGGSVVAKEEFRVWARWPANARAIQIRLKVVYEYEPPRRLAVSWGNETDASIFGTPTSDDWGLLYSAREKFNEPEQRFLFELDRQTNPNLLPMSTDVPAAVRVDRIARWDSLLPQLQERLEVRKRGLPAQLSPISPVDLLPYFSEVVRKATRALGAGENWARVGAVLEQFAAGDLHRTVCVPRDSKTVSIGLVEPDSYFIFFFAEFALAALEEPTCHAHFDMWARLLPSLVKMQRYFIGRFPERQCVTAFGEPPSSLDPAVRNVIDQNFVGRDGRKEVQALLMKENLDLAGDCF